MPKAVRLAMPLAYFRLAACQFAIMLACVAIGLAGFLMSSLSTPATRLSSLGGIATLAAMAVICLTIVPLIFRALHTKRTLKANPHACLNCLYPLAPDQPTCPECGRTQNRQDLSPRWREYLG